MAHFILLPPIGSSGGSQDVFHHGQFRSAVRGVLHPEIVGRTQDPLGKASLHLTEISHRLGSGLKTILHQVQKCSLIKYSVPMPDCDLSWSCYVLMTTSRLVISLCSYLLNSLVSTQACRSSSLVIYLQACLGYHEQVRTNRTIGRLNITREH